MAFELGVESGELRARVRTLIDERMPALAPEHRVNSWAVYDRGFTKALGAAGFIGMTWPKRYGGGERHPLERYVVIEELLAAGAPVGMHWISDRQSGPLLLKFGTEAQRQRFLPGIARGEIYACIGMSEPSSGSDLASVRTSARRVDGGWRVNGQKLWTTNAHNAHFMVTLVRTREGSARQEGLSQLLIAFPSEGVTIKPIADLTGASDFNEVFFDDVFVPDDMLIGAEGDGWKQVTAELSLERSGPERYLSSLALLLSYIDLIGPHPDAESARLIGELTAELWTLRQMSLAVAGKLAAGEDPMLAAAVLKDLGNAFEQKIPRALQARSDVDFAAGSDFARVLALLLMVSPSFSLRGGTREILRGIVARGLGLR